MFGSIRGGREPRAEGVGTLIAGMIAGADDIDGMDVVRHGAIPATFGGIRAPSTLGSFVRAFDHGNVRQPAAVHRRVLAELAAQAPVLPGADALAFIDVGSMQKASVWRGQAGCGVRAHQDRVEVADHARAQRAGHDRSTPLTAPVVTTVRLRGGNAASGRVATRHASFTIFADTAG